MGITRVASMAIVAALCLPASADPLPTVPMALLDAPPAFDAARFSTALETYVVTAQVNVRLVPVMTDDAVCASLLVAPTPPAVVWARWTATTIQLSVATAEKGCAAVESSTVDIPKDQPAFIYRVTALKVASLLRTLPAATLPAAPPEPLPALPHAVPPARLVEHPLAVAIELGATGVASTSSARRTSSLLVGAWVGKTASLGGAILASAAQEADAPGGSGTARMLGVLAGGRLTFPLSRRLSFISEVDLGVLTVGASADRVNGAAAMSDRRWTPVLSFDPHLGIQVAGPVYVLVGPTLDLSTHTVDITLGDTPLYHASLVRFRWDVRAQIWF